MKDEEKALSLSVHFDERRGPSLFRIFAIARAGVSLDALERGDPRGPRPARRCRTDCLPRWSGPGGCWRPTWSVPRRRHRPWRSFSPSTASTTGDPHLWREDFERILAVDAAAVRDAAGRLFTPERISVVEVHSGGER